MRESDFLVSTNNEKGRTIAVGISVYILVKYVVNGFLGDGFGLLNLVLGVVILVLTIAGLQYTNYGVAIYLASVAILHLPANISHIGSNWFYLLEGVIDILLAVALVTHNDVKEHFTNKWENFNK